METEQYISETVTDLLVNLHTTSIVAAVLLASLFIPVRSYAFLFPVTYSYLQSEHHELHEIHETSYSQYYAFLPLHKEYIMM